MAYNYTTTRLSKLNKEYRNNQPMTEEDYDILCKDKYSKENKFQKIICNKCGVKFTILSKQKHKSTKTCKNFIR
jgi:hypothetical protein